MNVTAHVETVAAHVETLTAHVETHTTTIMEATQGFISTVSTKMEDAGIIPVVLSTYEMIFGDMEGEEFAKEWLPLLYVLFMPILCLLCAVCGSCSGPKQKPGARIIRRVKAQFNAVKVDARLVLSQKKNGSSSDVSASLLEKGKAGSPGVKKNVDKDKKEEAAIKSKGATTTVKKGASGAARQ